MVSKDRLIGILGNSLLGIKRSLDRWRQVTPKGQDCDPKIFEAQYLKTVLDRRSVQIDHVEENPILRVQWSRDRWHHVTPKGPGHDAKILTLNISETVRDRLLVQIDYRQETCTLRAQ